MLEKNSHDIKSISSKQLNVVLDKNDYIDIILYDNIIIYLYNFVQP